MYTVANKKGSRKPKRNNAHKENNLVCNVSRANMLTWFANISALIIKIDFPFFAGRDVKNWRPLATAAERRLYSLRGLSDRMCCKIVGGGPAPHLLLIMLPKDWLVYVCASVCYCFLDTRTTLCGLASQHWNISNLKSYGAETTTILQEILLKFPGKIGGAKPNLGIARNLETSHEINKYVIFLKSAN